MVSRGVGMRFTGIASFLLILCCFVASAEEPPELVLQTGHSGSIHALAISPDGKWLVSGGQDSTLKIWNLQTGNLLRTLYGHNSKVVDVAISPDGRYVASAADDGTARLWEVAAGQQVRDLSGHRNMISSVAFAAGGQQVLTGSTDVVKIRESATGREIRSIPIPQKDQEGRLTVSSDGSVYVIGGAVNQPKTGYFSAFTGTGDIYRPLKIIEIASGRELMEYKTDVRVPFASYVLSPDSRLFAIRAGKVKDATVEESVRVFDVRSGREIATLKIPGAGDVNAMLPLAISTNGKWVAAQGQINNSMKTPVYVYDLTSKKLAREFTTSSVFIPSIGIDSVTFVSSPFAFSPDTTVLALGGSSRIQLWEPGTGKELQSLQTHLKTGATTDSSIDPQLRESLRAQGFTAEDTSILQQSNMESLMDEQGMLGQALDLAGNVPGVKGAMRHFLRDGRIRFSADGKWLLAQSPNYLRTWDIATGMLYQDRFPLLPPVAFSPDGRLYAAMEPDHEEWKKGNVFVSYLVIRNMETRTELSRMKLAEAPIDLAFHAENSTIAVHMPDQIRILDLKTLGTQRSFPIANSTADVSVFDNSGRFLAVGGKSVKPTSTVTAQPGDPTAFGIDPKMMEQLSKMMTGKKMSRKEMEKMQKEMEKMMKGQKPVEVPEPSIEDALKPSDYKVRIFDLQTGKEIQTLGVESIVHDLSKDGPATMSLMGGGSRDLHRMEFSKDGRYLAVEDLDQQYPSVKIYETSTGRRLSTFPVSRKKAIAPTNMLNMLAPAQVRPTFAFHPDGSLIAISAQEGGYAVNLWEVSTGKQITSLKHLNRVDALTFHPNGKFLVTRLREGSVNVWDLSGDTLIATLMEFPGLYFTTEWLVATPEGLFDGSPAAWNQIMWRFSKNIYDLAPVETFFNDFYYPGLLTELFSSKRPEAPRNLSQLDRRQPVVRLASDASGKTRTATLRVEVGEAPAGARDVRLFRNGTLVKVWRGDVLQGQSSQTLETTVKLTAGENRFVAYGFNQDNVKSADTTLKITGEESLRRKGIAYIVAIGINQYGNSNFNLKYAVADAQAFSANLQNSQQALGKYDQVRIISLFDQDATKAKIVSTLKSFASGGSMAAEPEDALIVYYAGHGTADKSHFYMVPHDLGYEGSREQMDDAALQTIFKNGISDQELEEILESVTAGQTLLVIDACNSGQALETEERRRGPMNAKGLAQLAYEKGMYILAAAQGYQAALEAAKLGHGYLTYALVEEGIKGKSADHLPQDGQVLVREWLNYASRRVPQMQAEKMQEARLLKHDVAFVDGEEKIQEVPLRSVQQPRIFYRREMESDPLIILKQ